VTIGVKKEPVASADHDDDDEEGDDEDAENTKEDSDEDNGDTAAELRVNLQKSQKEWGQLHKQYLCQGFHCLFFIYQRKSKGFIPPHPQIAEANNTKEHGFSNGPTYGKHY
jgi:hypothetical protein